MTGCLFQHNNKFYTQTDGVSMSNPLVPTITHFFMGILETTLFNKEDENSPVLYLRYADNIFCTFQKFFLLNTFHQKLNKLHNKIYI